LKYLNPERAENLNSLENFGTIRRSIGYECGLIPAALIANQFWLRRDAGKYELKRNATNRDVPGRKP
jgi:hypothetical protein